MDSKNTRQQGLVDKVKAVFHKRWMLRFAFGLLSIASFILRVIDFFKH